jgi:phage minor structural protein
MLYVLNSKEVVTGVLNNGTPFSCPYYDDYHVENINTGVHTYNFSVPADHEEAGKLEINGYILLQDLDSNFQMFQIKDIEDASADFNEKHIYCEHIAIPELLGNVVRPASLESYTLKNALLYVLDGTGWGIGDLPYTTSKDVIFEDHVTVLEAVLQIAETWESEIHYEVQFLNGEVKNRFINFVVRRGQETKKWFTYGKDLTDVIRKENSEGIITALIGVGRGDTDGNSLTLQNWSTTVPAGYEKPYDADWIGDKEALQRYGKKGKHIFGIYSVDAENRTVVFQETIEELKRRSKPALTFEMSVIALERYTGYEGEKVRVGDTVICKDTSFTPEIIVEARVIEIKRSYTDAEQDGIVLGDYVPITVSNDSSLQKLQQLIRQNEEKWNAKAYSVSISSSAGTTFRNGNGSTTLTARLFKGPSEVDTDGTIYVYRWKKKFVDGSTDTNFNATGKSVVITNTDIVNQAVYSVEVEL